MHTRGSSDWIRERHGNQGSVGRDEDEINFKLWGRGQDEDATRTTLGRDEEQAIGNRSMDP